jgi:hypothetical protein
MTGLTKSIAVALVHILIIASLGGKLLYDRAHRPRVWVRTGSVDPDLPIRGRYLALSLQVEAPWFDRSKEYNRSDVRLGVESGTLTAYPSTFSTGLSISRWRGPAGSPLTAPLYLDNPVLFFLPEFAEIPLPHRGEELWAEVTIPKKGPPRPIQLALKKGTEWKPLTYR